MLPLDSICLLPGAVLALFHDVSIVVGFVMLDMIGITYEFNL